MNMLVILVDMYINDVRNCPFILKTLSMVKQFSVVWNFPHLNWIKIMTAYSGVNFVFLVLYGTELLCSANKAPSRQLEVFYILVFIVAILLHA